MDEFSRIFFSRSTKMDKLRTVISEVSKTDMTVLIKGESGTGKELVAQTVHHDSHRRGKPFIKVNCAAIPKTLLESELFGFEKGAFTGANLQKPGKFELANEGTILLNEIGDMDISVQAKLLQVLQDGVFCRLGGEQNIAVDTRVVATTKDSLETSMADGELRQDLFYRINMVTLTVPPLRDRREQILPLVRYFLETYTAKYGKKIPPVSSRSLKVLRDYPWPGNVRESKNTVKRLVLFNDEEKIVQELGNDPAGHHGRREPLKGDSQMAEVRGIINLKEVGKKAAQEAEKEIIESTLQETHWNRKEAAKLLRVSYKALLYKIQKYRLDEIKRGSDWRGGKGT